MMYNFNYIQDKQEFCSRLRDEFQVERELKIVELDNGIILPGFNNLGGVFGKNNVFYENSALHRGLGGLYNPSEIIECDEKVVYLGMWHNIWGHCITDNLKHLWIFLHSGLFDKNYSFVYTTVDNNFSMPDGFKYILEKIGIDFNNLSRIQKPTRFKSVFIPDDCFIASFEEGEQRLFTKEYVQLLKKITDGIKPSLYMEKVYFTRTGIKGFKDFGEKTIEQLFKKKGYHIISPEKMNIKDQISILLGCKVFATTEGSCAHNAVFLNSKSDFIIIRKDKYINTYQLAINSLILGTITYIDCGFSILNNKKEPWSGPFYVYVSNYLNAFLKVKKRFYFNSMLEFIKYLCIGFLKVIRRIIIRRGCYGS